LVREHSLFEKAKALKLGEYLILGKGEQEGTGRSKPSILSGAYEALIGAIFLDGGYSVCESFVRNEFESFLVIDEDYNPKNAKSILQEMFQKRSGTLPKYEIVTEDGPDHKRMFVVAVFVEGTEKGRGEGRSKKEAEMAAAASAIENDN
jgi:ribonuclease III